MKSDKSSKKGGPKSDRSDGSHKSGRFKSGFKPKSKKELKFNPLDTSRGNMSQASYSSVKEALIARVTKEFDRGGRDVVQSLYDEVKFVIPQPELAQSQATDDVVRAREDQQNLYLFREAAKIYTMRVEVHEDALLLWPKD